MDDFIKRSDAIKAIEDLPNAYNGWSDTYDKAYIIGTLEEVPSADRPMGEWIYWRENGIKRCKCTICLTSYGCLDTPYCPNCGALMKGTDDERHDI